MDGSILTQLPALVGRLDTGFHQTTMLFPIQALGKLHCSPAGNGPTVGILTLCRRWKLVTISSSRGNHHCTLNGANQSAEWTSKECFQEEHQVEETLSRRVQGRFKASYSIGGMDPHKLNVYTKRTTHDGQCEDQHWVVIERRGARGWFTAPDFKCQLPLPAGLKLDGGVRWQRRVRNLQASSVLASELTCLYRSDEYIRQGSLVFQAPFAEPIPSQPVPIGRAPLLGDGIHPHRIWARLRASLLGAGRKSFKTVSRRRSAMVRYTIALSQIVFIACIFCAFAEIYPYLVKGRLHCCRRAVAASDGPSE